MYCLHCGDCCLRMSPISAPEPCPHIKRIGTFIFCGIYNNRPEECMKHSFPCRYCPIGVDVLKLENPQQIAKRIDDGYELLLSKRLEAQ